MHEAKQRAGIAYYCWNPAGYSARWKSDPPPPPTADRRSPIKNIAPSRLHVKLCWHSGTEWHLPFCKTTIINQKSNLTTQTTAIWMTNVQGASPACFPTVLFITFPSLTYSPQLLLPSPLLSAWNRHSRKYIFCKLSSCCYSWFHKWWWNGQESEGVNGKRWLLHVTTIFLRSPFS